MDAKMTDAEVLEAFLKADAETIKKIEKILDDYFKSKNKQNENETKKE